MTARVDSSNRPLNLVSKPRPGQPALHVATLSLVEAYPIFGFLRCLVGKARRIGGCQQVAVSRARTGFGNICTDENSQDRQCEDEDTQWLVLP